MLKKFVKMLLQDTLGGMGFNVDIKEDLAKLRLRVLDGPQEKSRVNE